MGGPLATYPPAPEEPTPPLDRRRHPFHTHEAIHRQPSSIAATLSRVVDETHAFHDLPPSGRLLFVGTGTSYHSALAAAQGAFAASDGRYRAMAAEAFTLVDSAEPLPDADLAVLVSASGRTAITRRAAERIGEANIPRLLITASPGSPLAALVDHEFVTAAGAEESWCHTVSHTTSICAGLGFASRPVADGPNRFRFLADAAAGALGSESQIVDWAERVAHCERVLIVGSGMARPTAAEAALKFREAAGRFSATVGVEELLHGVLPSVDSRTLVLAAATTPLERQRGLTGLDAAAALGAEVGLVSTVDGSPGEHELVLPSVPPIGSPVVQAVAFQLLAYWVAVADGRNPDAIGLDDERQLTAHRLFGT